MTHDMHDRPVSVAHPLHLFLPVAALALLGFSAGCKSSQAPPAISANDPAMVNMAPVATTGRAARPTRVLDARDQGNYDQQGTDYTQGTYEDNGNPAYDRGYEADQPPPPLPRYSQPPATRPNTIWTPGYWAWSPRGYYWVPGAWVAAPYQGALWTPPYWQHEGPHYRFHPGYWGRHIGFYGGVPYGYGYPGRGFVGGYWNGPNFYYNRAVLDVGPEIPYVYSMAEPAPVSVNISFNGPGGLNLLPIAAEIFAMRERHLHPVRMQYDGWREAGLNPAQFYIGGGWRPAYYAAPEIYSPERWVDEYVEPGPPVVEYRHDNGRHLGWYKEHGDNGNHFGEYKEHGDNGNHFGEFKEHGNPHGDEGWHDHGHGNGHGEGHGNGNGGGEGHGNGHGHGHD